MTSENDTDHRSQIGRRGETHYQTAIKQNRENQINFYKQQLDKKKSISMHLRLYTIFEIKLVPQHFRISVGLRPKVQEVIHRRKSDGLFKQFSNGFLEEEIKFRINITLSYNAQSSCSNISFGSWTVDTSFWLLLILMRY